jgi:DNA polymerase
MNDSWEKLYSECSDCTACELSQTRTNCVFGAGSKNADLLFVGEAPGDNEDKSGTPFVGRAGKLLNEYLDTVGIDRESVYIANILKCRPPKNRDPKPSEEDACIEYLHRQISLLNPKLIVCLGRVSAKRLISKKFRISEEHGTWFDYNGVPITAVYHPALLLRDPRKKDEMSVDMQMISNRLKEI